MTAQGILEDSSKKGRRGRPRRWTPERIAGIRAIWPAIRTDRGAQEKAMLVQAYDSITKAYEADQSANRWAEYYLPGKGQIVHRAILSALGRLTDTADRLKWAAHVAENKLSTRAACAAIRRVRLHREAKPDEVKLGESIETALNAYLDAHPSTPKFMVTMVLRELAASIEGNEDGDNKDGDVPAGDGGDDVQE